MRADLAHGELYVRRPNGSFDRKLWLLQHTEWI